MNQPLFRFVALTLLGLVTIAGDAHADAGFTNNTIRGTVRFSNASPVIFNLINAPNNEGMSNLYFTARSLPPQSRSATTDNLTAASRTSSPYQITVDSDAAGVRYVVTPRVTLLEGQEFYYYRSATSAPVVAFAQGPVLDFSECLGLVTLRFVTAGGAGGAGGLPVTVDSASVIVYDPARPTDVGVGVARVTSRPGSFTEQRLYVPTGSPLRLEVTVNQGTDTYLDRLQFFTSTNVLLACDELLTVNIVVPSVGELARIHGTVDMLGTFEDSVDGYDSLDYPDGSSVVAEGGPFANKRYAAVPGINFTLPASGDYVLTNVMPSTLDPLSIGYNRLYANMYFRSNRQIQSFTSPALGAGANPPVVVTPGAVINLSNTFVMNPGFLRGNILLKGPAEDLGRQSLLRGVQHIGDNDPDFDGVPDGIGNGYYGISLTRVSAEGVNRRASGATLTAAFGFATTDFDGSFNPNLASYTGDYELILGGLKGERSLWQQRSVDLFLFNAGVNDDDFINSILKLTDHAAPELEIVPGESVTKDIAYCFSEVCLRFHSANEPFYNPTVFISPGGNTNTDFRGRPVHYTVNVGNCSGALRCPKGNACKLNV